jgi:transposase
MGKFKPLILAEVHAAGNNNRRLARDFERYARSAAAFIRLAMIRIMLRRLTNPTLCS